MHLVPYDFEMRFTAAGGTCNRGFQDGLPIQVPFELWRIGVNTPEDPSDDVRLTCWIFDIDDDMTYNLSTSDHDASSNLMTPIRIGFTGAYLLTTRPAQPDMMQTWLQ